MSWLSNFQESFLTHIINHHIIGHWSISWCVCWPWYLNISKQNNLLDFWWFLWASIGLFPAGLVMVFRTSWYCAGWALIILHLAVYHQHQDYDNLRLPEMKPISLCLLLFPCLRFVTMIIPRLEEASLFLIDVISVWHQHIYEASIFMFMQQRQNYEVIQLDYFESIFKLYFASSSTFMFYPICSRFWY